MPSNDKALEDIKRLLMLIALKLGSNSDELGLALNVDASRVRQMMPTGRIKKIVPDKKQGK